MIAATDHGTPVHYFITAYLFLIIAAVMAEKKVEKFLMESDQKEAAAYTNNYLAHRVGITPKESTQIYDQWVSYEQVPLSKRSPRARLLVVRFMSDINQPSFPTSF